MAAEYYRWLGNQKSRLFSWCVGLDRQKLGVFSFPSPLYWGLDQSHFRIISFFLLTSSSLRLLSQAFYYLLTSVGFRTVNSPVFISFLLTCDGRHCSGVFPVHFDSRRFVSCFAPFRHVAVDSSFPGQSITSGFQRFPLYVFSECFEVKSQGSRNVVPRHFSSAAPGPRGTGRGATRMEIRGEGLSPGSRARAVAFVAM